MQVKQKVNIVFQFYSSLRINGSEVSSRLRGAGRQSGTAKHFYSLLLYLTGTQSCKGHILIMMIELIYNVKEKKIKQLSGFNIQTSIVSSSHC